MIFMDKNDRYIFYVRHKIKTFLIYWFTNTIFLEKVFLSLIIKFNFNDKTQIFY